MTTALEVQNAVDRFVTNEAKLNRIVNGLPDETISTDAGSTRTWSGIVDAAKIQISAAETFASAAMAAASILSPFVEAPDVASPFASIGQPELLKSIGGVAVTIPAGSYVRHIGRRSLDGLFRIAFAAIIGGTEKVWAGSTINPAGLGYIPAATYTGVVSIPIYTWTTDVGLPIGTFIGYAPVVFPAGGVSFGSFGSTYGATDGGALIVERMQPSEIDTANTDERVNRAQYSDDDRRGPAFPANMRGTYLDSIIQDYQIENGVPGRGYVLNVRSDMVGSTRRLHFGLTDTVRNKVVAIREIQLDRDFSADIPESLYLSGAALGRPINRTGLEYTGIGMTLFMRPGAVRFDQGATAYTGADYVLDTKRIWSPEETRQRILTGQGVRNKVRAIGSGGDYPTFKAAVDYLLSPTSMGGPTGTAPDDIRRDWFPFSDICTPSHQWTLQALPGLSEVMTALVPSGISYARGILLWMGLTFRLLPDTSIKGETTGGVTTYTFDINYGGRIIGQPGSLVWTDGATQAVHQDSGNALSIPTAANASDPLAGTPAFLIAGHFENVRFRGSAGGWSAGTDDLQDMTWKGVVFEATDSAGNPFSTHTSPNNKFAGMHRLDSCTFVGGTGRATFSTINTVVARHGVEFKNSDIGASNIISGGTGYVRIGKQPGLTYPSGMEP